MLNHNIYVFKKVNYIRKHCINFSENIELHANIKYMQRLILGLKNL